MDFFFFSIGNPSEPAEMKNTNEMLKHSMMELQTYFTADPRYKCGLAFLQ